LKQYVVEILCREKATRRLPDTQNIAVLIACEFLPEAE
jgi:hypothetical protein